MSHVLFLREVSGNNAEKVGRNLLLLSKLKKAGFNVPNGFILLPSAFQQFVKERGLVELINKTLTSLDEKDLTRLDNSSKLIQESLFTTNLPRKVDEEAKRAYQRIGMHEELDQLSERLKSLVSAGRGDVKVVVKPFIVEAEMNLTTPIYNVRGTNTLKKNIIKAWIEVFQPQNLYLLKKKKINPFNVGIFVQEMVNAEKSCVVSNFNPVNGSTSEMVIEACYGFGNAITEGELTPDLIVVSKERGDVLLREEGNKEFMYAADPVNPRVVREAVNGNLAKANVLNDREITEVYELMSKIENELNMHVVLELAIQRNRIYLVNVTGGNPRATPVSTKAPESYNSVGKGRIISAGLSEGHVVKISTPAELNKVNETAVMVARSLSMHFTPVLHKLAGMVCSKGGMFSNLAYVLREENIPAVCIPKGYEKLSEGELVVVDAYSGEVGTKISSEPLSATGMPFTEGESKRDVGKFAPRLHEVVTATKIGLILKGTDEDEMKHEIAEVLLLPAEKLIKEDMRETHDRYSLQTQIHEQSTNFLDLERAISEVVENTGVMVWVKSLHTFMHSDDVRKVMLACKNVFSRGFRNIGLVYPACVLPRELRELASLIDSMGLRGIEAAVEVDRAAGLFMGEILSTLGIGWVLINLDAVMRSSLQSTGSSPSLASHEGFLRMLESGLEGLNSSSMKVMAYGRITNNPDVIKILVNQGADAIFVDVDDFTHAKYWAARFEKQALLDLLKSKYRFKMRR